MRHGGGGELETLPDLRGEKTGMASPFLVLVSGAHIFLEASSPSFFPAFVKYR